MKILPQSKLLIGTAMLCTTLSQVLHAFQQSKSNTDTFYNKSICKYSLFSQFLKHFLFFMLHLSLFIFLVGCSGCGVGKDVVVHKSKVSEMTKSKNEGLNQEERHVKKELSESFKKTIAHLPKEQQDILLRRDFNRSIKTFDTTNLSLTDTIPFRFIDKNYKRIPFERTIGTRKMQRGQDAAYHGQDYERKLSYLERYPGIVIVSNDRKGWEETIEYYNENKELVNTFDIQAYNPYYKEDICKKKGIKPGAVDGENIEDISDPMTMRGKDFRKEAQSFLSYGEVQPQSTSELTPIIYKLYGVKDGICIGYETMVVIIDTKGNEVYRRQFPVDVSIEILAGNNFLTLLPDKEYVPYMTDGEKQKEYFVLVDLKNKTDIYKVISTNNSNSWGGETWHENLIEIRVKGGDLMFLDIESMTLFKTTREKFKTVGNNDPMRYPIFSISKI